MSDQVWKEKQVQISASEGSLTATLLSPDKQSDHRIAFPKTLAICNLGGGLAMAILFLWLKSKLELSTSSVFVEKFLPSFRTNISLPSRVLDVMTSTSTSTSVIFVLFMLAALFFSITLTIWASLAGSQSPSKTACWITTLGALVLGMVSGLSTEEYFMMLMPVSVGFGLVISSLQGQGK